MTHHFAVHVEKKKGSTDMRPVRGVYQTDSNRMNKVAKLFKEWAIKEGILEEKDIENIYLQKLK